MGENASRGAWSTRQTSSIGHWVSVQFVCMVGLPTVNKAGFHSNLLHFHCSTPLKSQASMAILDDGMQIDESDENVENALVENPSIQ
jgi:hypothetical protein